LIIILIKKRKIRAEPIDSKWGYCDLAFSQSEPLIDFEAIDSLFRIHTACLDKWNKEYRAVPNKDSLKEKHHSYQFLDPISL
jgi:hypothetical protein